MSVLNLVDRGLVSADKQAEVVAVLRKMLFVAEKGEIDTVVIIAAHPNSEWRYDFAGTHFTTEMLGRLDIIKAEWIAKFLANEKL